MTALLGQNGLVVCSVVIASALAAHHILWRVVPFVVGAACLSAALACGLVAGAWRWLTGSLDLEEEELGRAITRKERSEKPCDGQLEQWPDKRGPTIEVDLDDDLDDDLEMSKRKIQNALS